MAGTTLGECGSKLVGRRDTSLYVLAWGVMYISCQYWVERFFAYCSKTLTLMRCVLQRYKLEYRRFEDVDKGILEG